MIIRKPYAFFIKHFKLIHLLLLIPTIYLMFKFGDIASFFKDYASLGNKVFETSEPGNYVTVLLYVALFVEIIINLTIYLLMRSKKKPNAYYALSILYYVILTIMSVVLYTIMSNLQTKELDPTIVNFIRDLAGIIVWPIYAVIAVNTTKAVGFNFKSFRFERNGDLQVTDEDEEEIELKFGSDKQTTKKTLVRMMRELKYYFLENKFVFTCVGAVILLALAVTAYMNYQVYNKRYSFNQAFALDNFTMTLKESYITDVDERGGIIDKNHIYLVVKLNITNKTLKEQKIDKSNFRIYFNKSYIYPSYDKSGRFIDIAKGYTGETLYKQSSNDYTIVYELDKDMIKNDYEMKILSGLKHEPGKLIPTYKILHIKPTNILEIEDLGEIRINKEVSLKNTTLGDTKYKLRKVTFTNNYTYDSSFCVTQDDCYSAKSILSAAPGKQLMVIEDEVILDENTSYYKNGGRDIYRDFATIICREKTTTGIKKYQSEMRNVTPESVTKYKIYEVSSTIRQEPYTDVSIKFLIRNKVFTVNL